VERIIPAARVDDLDSTSTRWKAVLLVREPEGSEHEQAGFQDSLCGPREKTCKGKVKTQFAWRDEVKKKGIGCKW
jgi:hypothetical protein